jgi:NAD(P)-dependent dehydrogenase (short-subunit alcohol dehydrogenase family)
MDLRVNGKNIVVTGGASGIGEAIADRLESEGAVVTVVDLAAPKVHRPFVCCDLADPHAIATACDELPTSLFGLVNCAGVSGVAPAETVMRVNFIGLRELTESLLPRLEATGAVVNIASGAGMLWRDRLQQSLELITTPSYDAALAWVRAHPMSGAEAYDFSKEVLVVYSQHIALRRFATDAVRVNSVSPGAVKTPLLPAFYESMDRELLDCLSEATGGDGEPEDIANVVAFVLSPMARWLNGTDIDVSGGADGAILTGALRHPSIDSLMSSQTNGHPGRAIAAGPRAWTTETPGIRAKAS